MVETRTRRIRRPRDPEATRHSLLVAGTRLFAERGYEGAPLSVIADPAGVNKAMVSYHFGGKRKLYLAIVTATFADLVARVEPLPGRGRPAPELLRELIALIAEGATRGDPRRRRAPRGRAARLSPPRRRRRPTNRGARRARGKLPARGSAADAPEPGGQPPLLLRDHAAQAAASRRGTAAGQSRRRVRIRDPHAEPARRRARRATRPATRPCGSE